MHQPWACCKDCPRERSHLTVVERLLPKQGNIPSGGATVTFKSSTYKICASGWEAYEKAMHTSKSSKHLQYNSCAIVIFFPIVDHNNNVPVVQVLILCQNTKDG